MHWTVTIRDTREDVVRIHFLEARSYSQERILEILEETNPHWEIINLVEGGKPPKKKEE